ncbi:capsule biosynthesis protein [Pseudooceanicola nanhaiensis]|uniref:capsule biosynthesis protein n=1 Tax=Pseudooceanicola nanhaiensis TaxID=375761 RepID=UPI001CD6460F|nr:capsule biosynthesis protein [Pseudooceanicola nanhaiensis]MCA0919443.1 capsule biosynthesis protein [Pseudooceanicola nanhaiensis]
MTTKPKAKKFRLRRGEMSEGSAKPGAAEAPQIPPIEPESTAEAVVETPPAGEAKPASNRPASPVELRAALMKRAETAKATKTPPAAAKAPPSEQPAPPAEAKAPEAPAGTPRAAVPPRPAAPATPAAPSQPVRPATVQVRRLTPAQAQAQAQTPPTPQATAQAPVQPTRPAAQAARPQPATPGTQPAKPAARPATPPRDGEVTSAHGVKVEQDIDTIRKEGLTGRQLRMARRVAQKHGLAATSDFDAVRQLRARGIDPFSRTNMLDLVVNNGQPKDEPTEPRVQLPQTVEAGKQDAQFLPSTEVASPMQRRMREIGEIQKDIAKRRRRRTALLFTRLAFFVFAPTILAGWYFYGVATPMYAAKSEFLILQADNQGGGGLGGLLSGTQFATNQDSIAVQSYLQSKDAMVRLDRDVGFKSHFSQPWIDPIQRLSPDPSNEEAYKVYKKDVKIGYDPTEGVIRMEVVAADPTVASQFSEALIGYAEDRVDELSRRKREDGMATARESLERAKAERREAQEALVQLQEGSVVDPEGIIAGLRAQINNIEVQLQEKQLQLQALLDNARPNSARVEGARGDVDRLQGMLDDLNAKMTDATTGDSSLAEKAARIQMAQADLATADLFLQSALQNEKQTELEANRQVRYLTTSVRPVPPEDPSYPRAFENTVLAFLIFSGIYLMISLTASILREQVSS